MTPGHRGIASMALLAAACSTSASKADNRALCATVRSALAGVGLDAIPSQQQARDAATGLDPLVTAVADPGLHEDVIRLHQHLHQLDVAWSRHDQAAVAQAAQRARADVDAVDRACRALPPTGGQER
jgi:hypothetical protein